jgi:hypothetical protein
MQLAPIVVFAYNRPLHLRQTLESLSLNPLSASSKLIIYCDGPKLNADAETLLNIAEAREVAAEKNWCGTVTIVESEVNKGLAASIIEGVTSVVNEYGKIIVVEDDVLLSIHFLKFMNDALDMYQDDEKVQSIGSWNYFCQQSAGTGNFFYRYPDSIAWGTFKRAWKLFEPDGSELLRKIEEQNKLSHLDGNLDFPYFSNMLKMQIAGKISSWAIRWTATGICHDMLSFFPEVSLSKHIGFGAAATHEKHENDYNALLNVSVIEIPVRRIHISENVIAMQEWRRFVKKHFVPARTAAEVFKALLRMMVPDFILQMYSRR